MKGPKLRIAAGLGALALLGAAAAAGYMAGAQRGEASLTRLSLATCGLVPAPAPLELPLEALMQKAGAPGLTLGPILHPGLDAPLSVVFRPLEPETTPQPVQSGETLTLPLDTARLPDEVRLSCRHGAVARVEYRRGPLRHALDVVTSDPEPAAAPAPAQTPAPADASAGERPARAMPRG